MLTAVWSLNQPCGPYRWCVTSNYRTVVQNAGPFSYLRLNEASGATAADFSDNRYHSGVYVGTIAAYGVTGLPTDSTSLGVDLDGSTNYITVPSVDAAGVGVGNAAFSLEAWVQVDAAQTGQLAGALAASNDGGFAITLTAGVPKFSRYNVSAAHDDVTSSKALATSGWNHVVATYDGATMNLYLNGALVGTGASSKVIPSYLAAQHFAWGANDIASPASFLDASLTEVAVYTKALSASDVAAHFNLGSGEFAIVAATPDEILTGNVPFGHIASANTAGYATAAAVNVAGAGAGSSATFAGNDMAGTATVTAAGTPAVDASILDVTFGVAYPVAPIVLVTAASDKAAKAQLFSASVTTAGFSVQCQVAPTAADVLTLNYFVVAAQ